ncbi:hypothetical protein [Holdemania massiliensis]|uniref:hypothetical protein n=1 Tax=Holdemania massiliensis TaxID=1468449 RepID=UPI001F050B8F|nr:hypothetical protein [Holdemania massiliensis]MCH1941698.1 hypothetical protein [Holdemania massiliensis]
MSKWKKGLSSWPCSVFLIAVLLSLLIFLPLTRNLRQILTASSSIKPMHFWQMEIQNSLKEKTEILFQPYTFEDQTLFQAISERSCLLVSVNDQAFQVILPNQSLTLHENDQLHFLWLVDPELISHFKLKVAADQTWLYSDGQLQEVK